MRPLLLLLTAGGQITPGFGAIVHAAGHDTPEGIHHGVLRMPDDPSIAAELCAALTR